MDAHRPPITTTNLVTAAVALVLVGVAVTAVMLMPSGTDSVSDMEYAVWAATLAPGPGESGLVLGPETLADRVLSVLDELGGGHQPESPLEEPFREALRDLRRKSGRAFRIENRFPPESGILLGGGGDRVSRIGFSRRGRFALVLHDTAEDVGYLLLLRWTGAEWAHEYLVLLPRR